MLTKRSLPGRDGRYATLRIVAEKILIRTQGSLPRAIGLNTTRDRFWATAR